MTKKIALLKAHLSRSGGVEKQTRYIAEGFARKGFDVTVLTRDPICFEEDIKVVQLGKRVRPSYRDVLEFEHKTYLWLKKNPQDVVFGMERVEGLTHYRAGNGVHYTYLQRRKISDPWYKRASFRFNPLHKQLLRLDRAIFESDNLRKLFVNSTMVKNEVLQNYNISPDQIKVVLNGVEWKDFEKPFERSWERENGPFQFLFIGNGWERKGLFIFLRALARLKDIPFELKILGREKNPLTYVNLANSLGLHKKVHFVGEIQDLIPFYRAADCLVIPSIYDPFANVTLEALAMGLFVVSSPYNGGSEVLTADSGIVLNDLQEEAFARSLRSAMERAKTETTSRLIRSTVGHLDIKEQIDSIVSDNSLYI